MSSNAAFFHCHLQAKEVPILKFCCSNKTAPFEHFVVIPNQLLCRVFLVKALQQNNCLMEPQYSFYFAFSVICEYFVKIFIPFITHGYFFIEFHD
jgi:hypothetical protein